MLEDALGSRSKVRLVRELVRSGVNEVTTDDLVKATGQSTGTLVPALQQLALSGVLATRLVGKSRVFKLAPDHPITPALRRIFEEEAKTIHQLADAIVRKAGTAGLRYVFWVLDTTETDDRRQTVWLIVIADDATAAEAAFKSAMGPLAPFNLRTISVEETRSKVMANDGEYLRLIEHGRVVHADRGWLDKR